MNLVYEPRLVVVSWRNPCNQLLTMDEADHTVELFSLHIVCHYIILAYPPNQSLIHTSVGQRRERRIKNYLRIKCGIRRLIDTAK